MKTKTYARLSLLLPFLLWGLGLVYSLITSSLALKQPDSFLSTPIVDSISAFISFYVIGIIFWLLPYLMLFVFLFVLTFKSSETSLMWVFLLSPFIMAALMLLEAAVFLLISPNAAVDPGSSFMNSMGLYILFVGMSLVWGYICVGLGFGVYKLLQSTGVLPKEANPELASSLANAL